MWIHEHYNIKITVFICPAIYYHNSYLIYSSKILYSRHRLNQFFSAKLMALQWNCRWMDTLYRNDQGHQYFGVSIAENATTANSIYFQIHAVFNQNIFWQPLQTKLDRLIGYFCYLLHCSEHRNPFAVHLKSNTISSILSCQSLQWINYTESQFIHFVLSGGTCSSISPQVTPTQV